MNMLGSAMENNFQLLEPQLRLFVNSMATLHEGVFYQEPCFRYQPEYIKMLDSLINALKEEKISICTDNDYPGRRLLVFAALLTAVAVSTAKCIAINSAYCI
jgi:hypothetical protein